MKKTATGLTLAAALSLSAFAAAPASAQDAPYANCTQLYNDGFSHIPSSHSQFTPGLDQNRDGIGCEKDGYIRLDTPATNASEGYHDPTDQALPDAAYTYPDCADAYAAGVYNIPAAADEYHDDLDSDQDGVACEYNVEHGVIVEGREEAARAEIAALVAAESAPAEDEASEAVPTDAPQVAVVPQGAVETGAEGQGAAPMLAVGALGLAAVAGAGAIARRRQA